MSSIKIVFENPRFLLLLIPAFLIILIPFFTASRNRRPSFKRIAPVILHILIVTMLIMIIAGMEAEIRSDGETVIVLMDCSDSMEDVSDDVAEKTQSLLNAFSKKTNVGVAAFSESCIVVLDPRESSRTLETFSIDEDGSELENSLEYVSELFPEEEAARIILLSDGKETEGSAERAAYALAKNGIEIDVMYFDTLTTEAEMQMVSVSAEASCQVGDTVELTADLLSNTAGTAVLTLSDAGETIDTFEVTVNSGTNLYTLTATPMTSGSHDYAVSLTSSADTGQENNTAYVSVTAEGEQSILLVSGTISDTELLSELLMQNGCNVQTVTSQNLPKSIIELCRYDEIVLLNVNAEDLPDGAEDLLEKFVSDYGRTLLAVGGTNTFQYGSMTDTSLEKVLPVNFKMTDTEGEEGVALMLVLDCSSSMSSNSSNLSLAKEGAVKVVSTMNASDFIGIVSFNSTATLQAGLTQATEDNLDALSRVISQLKTSRGTYYTQALQLAYQELQKSDAETKHVIFLSDGNPNDSGYTQVVQNMADDGITVSTIGLGVSSDTLSNLAQIGQGRYYYVSSTGDLPDIMLSETEQVVTNALIDEDTAVQIRKQSGITEGIDEASLPALSGYIGVTAKDDADVLLASADDRPILTIWNYGNGTAAVFSGDLTGNWSKAWFNSAAGQTLIRNICTGLIDVTERISSIQADIETEGTNVTIRVLAAETESSDILTADIQKSSGNETVELQADSDGTYTADVVLEECGNHSLVILQTDADGNTVDYLTTVISVNYSSEYDAFRDDGETLLLHLAELTGGIVSDSVRELASKNPVSVRLSLDPAFAFCIIALILFLADVAIRKVRMKDIRQFFRFRGR